MIELDKKIVERDEIFVNDFKVTVDARKYPPKEKHGVIMDTYKNLKSGEKMELINDHDPKPLYYQFSAEHPEEFQWDYIERGPEVWRVSISKI